MQAISKQLAYELSRKDDCPFGDWDILRDWADIATAGELDAFKLDMLADWIWNIQNTPNNDK